MTNSTNGIKHYFFKGLDIIMLLFLPPIGIIFLFTSERFSTVGKIIGSIYTVLFLVTGTIIFE